MTEAAPPATLLLEHQRAAERILRRRFGGRALITGAEALAGRATVFRCHLEGRGLPRTAVVKTARAVESKPYDAKDMAPGAPAWALANEAAGLAFLDQYQPEDEVHISPAFYGADIESGVVVLEDLGEGASLADALLGNDAAAAEVALVAFGRTLGVMHARTAGAEAEYLDLLESFGRSRERQYFRREVRALIQKLPETFAELDFEWSPGLVDDVQQVAKAFLEPGPFSAYTHGDPCPDNDRLIAGRMVLFDFEHGAFRNLFADGASGRVPFPACWCVNRLTPWVVAKFETAYRLELMKGVPQAGDDVLFERSLMEAAGMWLIGNANDLLPRALRLEQQWGISTFRQRLLFRFEAFAQMSARSGQLESLGVWAYLMHQRFCGRWPEVADMPLYPAWRQD